MLSTGQFGFAGDLDWKANSQARGKMMTQQIERLRAEGDRYQFDFDACHFKKGWAQFDTGQDASWFGQWANPFQLRIVTFAEGDVTVETAANPQEFTEMVRKHAAWNAEEGYRFAIDGMCQGDIIGKFRDLGLSDLLH